MGMFLNRGTQEFERVINSEIYIDKTDMISFFNKVIDTEQSYICVSRPRRFGKSITANMIAAYYERGSNSAGLFEGRKLSELSDWDRNMNKYDVIRIDLAGICAKEETPEYALDYIEKILLQELADEYSDAVELYTDSEKLSDTLDRINTATGTKFIIIIDEWDALFRDEKCNKDIQIRYINLLRTLFKDNRAKKFTALAYITGILPIKKYNSESALNNFYEYTMTSPGELAPYIGFSDEEVKMLCDRYDMDYKMAKYWYDGYSFKGAEHVYGPNSIVKAMLAGSFENYWSQTVAFNSLAGYITMNFDGLKDDIMYMIGGGRVPVKVSLFQNDMVNFKSKDDVLTVLIHLGYVAYDTELCEVYIPNNEVRQIFEDNLTETGWSDVIDSINASEELLQATLDMDEDTVAEMIEDCHMKNVSVIKYNNENSLSCVLTLAYLTAKRRYMVVREMPAGRGFADLVFVPKRGNPDPAMIIELKWKKDTETAISRIKDRQYIKGLDGYHGNVLLVGISYEKSKRGEGDKKHSCVIEEIRV